MSRRNDREDEDYIDVNRVREALGARPSIFDNASFDPATYDPPNTDPSYACGMRATCEADSAEIADLRQALKDAENTLQTLTDQRDEAIGEAQQHAEDYMALLDRYAMLRHAVLEAGRRYFLGYITHEQYVAEIDAVIPVKL